MLLLHDYFRSSASFRVRIALELKGLAYQKSQVHLVRDGGEHYSPAYRRLNPAGLVPVLSDGAVSISQSLAIVEYLEETRPEPALLPEAPVERAWVRSVALSIACDVHPLNNLRVLKYLEHELAVPESARKGWYAHWVEDGLATVEAMLKERAAASGFALGDAPTLADICIVPQVANALRFACKLSHVPRISQIYNHCMSLPAFQRAAPESVEPV